MIKVGCIFANMVRGFAGSIARNRRDTHGGVMKKLISLLVVAALLVVTASLYMWSTLHREREQNATTQVLDAELQTAQTETQTTLPVPPPAGPTISGETVKSPGAVKPRQETPR